MNGNKLITIINNGDRRRRREAMENLFTNFLHNNDSDNSNIASILRTVIERGWYNEIKQLLINLEEIKHKEIDKICFLHYNEFLNSIQEIISLRKCIYKLRDIMLLLNKEFNAMNNNILNEVIIIEKHNNEYQELINLNIAANENLTLINKMITIKDLIKNNNYNKAVILLKDIQTTYSNNIKVKFIYNNVILKQWLPEVTSEILTNEARNLSTFLNEVRHDSILFGSTLIRRSANIFKEHSIQHYSNICIKLNNIYTYSILYTWRLSSLFRLDLWAEPADFEKIPSIHYTYNNTNSSIVNNSEENDKKLKNIYEQLGRS